jgi:hypothetical protein
MPTRCEDSWLTDQLQVLLGRLTQAAGIGEQMPDYGKMPAKGAGPRGGVSGVISSAA